MDPASRCPPGAACSPPPPPKSQNMVDSRIMVVAVVVLFAVVLFILCLHIYAKWFWRHQGAVIVTGDGTFHTISFRRRRYRGDPSVQNANGTAVHVTQSVGLEPAIVEALPSFEYSAEEMKQGLECVVCLEEFEEGEKGRTLPKCGHNFHLDCIDMWLHSHSTCPLCRTSVGDDGDVKQSEAVAVEILEQPPAGQAAVVGDVGAPFMVAMRASRRRRRRSRGQLPSVSNLTGANSLPRAVEDHDGENDEQRDAGTDFTPAVDRELAASTLQQSLKDYETPSANASTESTSGSSIRAPFQVTIDIPRAGAGIGNSANVMSPMARASASFRRLLSRGKTVVTPQSPPEGTDVGSPSSPHAQLPPPPSA